MSKIREMLESLIKDGLVSEEFAEGKAGIDIEEVIKELERIQEEYMKSRTGERKVITIINKDNYTDYSLYFIDRAATPKMIWKFLDLMAPIIPHEKGDWDEFIGFMLITVFPDAEGVYGEEEYYV